ncbi:translesion error-prone DNA polymerase V subunit UmuC [Desulfurispira natronophila]|uniref:DNA polymerase V n=1 Tax=Desulfurispira natronophila TaxID=682562 RepID=A0A7W7Y5R0_9BACT|nr:translesion error-prone DNA polymerase V subunit UmuC [Desulfurispira natronophila]MBB5022586.1 DNA polymerase V [Desulfurispira natronophila]
MNTCFALVDCNSFYASCEKIFRPDLRHRPVIVLSNNDGCVVARSSEAKALGIGMGVPFYQVEDLVLRYNIAVFSSNYTLYADISQRVMATLEHLAPQVEIYSIDEAFLDLSPFSFDPSLPDLADHIRSTVRQWTGITTCIGIAPSKTLAKLANQAAKRYPATNGVVDLRDPQRQERLLRLMPASEVWGIGRKTAHRLSTMGIETAWQLATAATERLRKRLSINVSRTQRELRGEACFRFEDSPALRKQLICSRSFGERVTTIQPMSEAICTYASRAAERLRAEQLHARRLTVFIRTSPFDTSGPGYSNSAGAPLPFATNDTRHIIELATDLLSHIWRQGYAYIKGGVMLSELTSNDESPPCLFHEPQERQRSTALMEAVDHINRNGKSQIWFGGQGCSGGSWQMKRARVSPAYTSRWQDIPVVR